MSYFAIGIERCKTEHNVGTLWRSACIYGAAFIFTIGARYHKQATDTVGTWATIPLFHFESIDDLIAHLPYSCPLVGVELDAAATPIERYRHMDRCAYLLGAEDHGLTREAASLCHQLVQLPGHFSMNVASAGTVIMYDRWRSGRRESALRRRGVTGPTLDTVDP
jgi:tRNA G18 (ribose-2'-O)-methylase SpoU